MPDTIDIVIQDYEETMAEGIAQMWNTWDSLWPGGFTQGVPFTADRVKKQFVISNALAILIAVDQKSNKPMGSCTLFEHMRDKEAAYIGTLGVSPEALGKKVGKKLLLESIRRSMNNGYTRVDLNTWAGNMKAVPLYKKIGMMWNPEGVGVHLEDYIPGILNHPLCSTFFELLESDDAWYETHMRELTQAPDQFEHKGMDVFPYKFTNQGNSLSVIVDRIGRGITAIDSNIGDVRTRVEATVSSHQVICGFPYTYTLEIENGGMDPIDVVVELEGFEGIKFDESNNLKQRIMPKEVFNWNVPFHLESTATLFRNGIKGSNIISKLNINGIESTLNTGLRIKSAIELHTRWGNCKIAVGGRTSVPLTISSNIMEDATIQLSIDDMAVPLSLNIQNGEMSLPSGGLCGTSLIISASSELQEGTHDAWVSIDLETEKGYRVKTRKFRIPIFCLGVKDVAVGYDDIQGTVIVASNFYDASFEIEGALFRVSEAFGNDRASFMTRSAIGPPFGINPFLFAKRESAVTSTESEVVVSLTANHPDRPLFIEDRVSFQYKTGIIKYEVYATNRKNESETFQLRLTGRGGGIQFNRGVSYIPLAGGLTKLNLGNFYGGYPALPSEPSAFSEGWIALESGSRFVGQFWDLNTIEELRLISGQMNMMNFPTVTLKPGETRQLSQIWFTFGVKDWTDIQRQWKSFVKKEYENQVDSINKPEICELVNVAVHPIIVPYATSGVSQVSLRKTTMIPLEGKMRISAPKGWTAQLMKSKEEVDETHSGKSFSTDINLTQDSVFDLKLLPNSEVNDSFAIHRGVVEFTSAWNIKKAISVIQLGSSNDKVDVSEDIDLGLKIFRVSNGHLKFTVSPDYGGCLISLLSKKGSEFLSSAFPTPGPKPGGFFENYYGGVQPLIFDDQMGEDLSKARTNKEKMSADCYEHGIWKGVEINWVGAVQKLAHGVEFNLRYLTTPGSPIVVIQWVISNKTSAPIKFYPSFFVDPRINGQLADYRITTEWSDQVVDLKKGMVPIAATASANYVWIRPPEGDNKSSGFCFMMANNNTRILSATLGELILLGAVESTCWLKPGDEHTITGALLVDPDCIEDIQDLQEVLDRII